MFLTRQVQTWLFYYDVIPYQNPFLSYVVLLRYLRWTFISSPYKHTFITLLFILKRNSLCSLREFFFSWNKIFYHLYLFPSRVFLRCCEKKMIFYYIRNIPAALEGLYYFRLENMFYLVSFLLTCIIFRVLEKHLLLRQRKMFYHFLCFREIALARLHIYYLRVFVLITYLQCIFICLRCQWRTIFLRLNNMFFRIAFVSDIWEHSYHFALIICFSILHLYQVSRKNHITSP